MKTLRIVATLMSVSLVVSLACEVEGQESTREDFKEYCQAMQGRWVGDVTYVADWPGLGKKGEKVTAYCENTISEDGNALTSRVFGGNGSGTGVCAFDPLTRQIKSMWVTSGGYVSQCTIYKTAEKWIEKGLGSNPDGAKNEYTSTVTISDGGNTHTWTGSGTLGGKPVDEQHDVWRRVSK